MNRGAEMGAGTLTFFVIVFAFIVFFALGGYQLVNLAGAFGVSATGSTGLEAFIFGNLSLFVMLSLIVTIIFVGAWGLRQ